LTYLLSKNGFVKIKKIEFDWDKAIKQIEKFKREITVKLTEPLSKQNDARKRVLCSSRQL
jgi:hypothetical protein